MCKTTEIIQQFRWHELFNVTEEPELVPNSAGVYCIKVEEVGVDPLVATLNYMGHPYMQSLKQLDEHYVGLLSEMRIPNPRKWTGRHEYAMSRLIRLDALSTKTESCPILYLGCTKHLRNRFEELVYGVRGHTASHALWPLILGEWKLKYGWFSTEEYKNEERYLKDAYRNQHNGQLPPLMDR